MTLHLWEASQFLRTIDIGNTSTRSVTASFPSHRAVHIHPALQVKQGTDNLEPTAASLTILPTWLRLAALHSSSSKHARLPQFTLGRSA